MIDKKDENLFLKVFFGDSSDVVEKFNTLKKEFDLDIGFLKHLLEQNPNSFQVELDSGDYSLDIFEEKAKTVIMFRKDSTLYYITEGSAVKISENGAFEQIDLDKSGYNITKYTIDKSLRESGLVVRCKTNNRDYNSTEFATLIPCDADEVLKKLQLKNFTIDQLVQFINENTNQASSSFSPETVFLANHGVKSISIRDNAKTGKISFIYQESRNSKKVSLGNSLEEAQKNIQPYLNSDFQSSKILFDMLTKIDPRLKATKQEGSLLGDNYDQLFSYKKVYRREADIDKRN